MSGKIDMKGMMYYFSLEKTLLFFFHYVIFSVPPQCAIDNPCVNGTCVDISNTEYRCKCNTGFIGKNCTGIREVLDSFFLAKCFGKVIYNCTICFSNTFVSIDVRATFLSGGGAERSLPESVGSNGHLEPL